MNLKILLPSGFLALLAFGAAGCGGGDDSGPCGTGGDAGAGSDNGNEGDSNDGGSGNVDAWDNCTFRVDLSGGVDESIDWDNGCGGLAGGESLELVFIDGRDSEGLLFLISVSGIEKGDTGKDCTATISILGTTDEDAAISNGTEESDCIVDITSAKKIESGLDAAIYAVKGRVTCPGPAAGSFGDREDIEIGEIEFEAEVAWVC